jgi:hypothetical protein
MALICRRNFATGRQELPVDWRVARNQLWNSGELDEGNGKLFR